VVPPRDTVKRCVLATRSPHRPNPIGLTAARLVSVRGRRITIAEHDLLDGTPVLDVKPYVPYCDAHPDAAAGWLAGVERRLHVHVEQHRHVLHHRQRRQHHHHRPVTRPSRIGITRCGTAMGEGAGLPPH